LVGGYYHDQVAGEENKVFWGADAVPMLVDYLNGDPLFNDPQFRRCSNISIGQARKMPGPKGQ